MHSATRLFRHLMANAGFRDAFRRRLDALLETTFSSANVAATFDEVLEDYAELVPLELERFDPPSMWLLDGKVRLHRQEPDFSYDDRMQEIRRFIAERPAVVRRALDTHLPEGGES